jgi:tetratricopeptide (TPR) repeat protein
MKPPFMSLNLSPEDLALAYEASPDDPETLYQLGLGFYQAKRLEEAEKIFRRMVILDPENAKGFATLGVFAWNRGSFDDAFNLFSRALEIDSSDPDTLVNLGLISEQLGELELAISLLQAYLVLCPNDDGIKNRLEALRQRIASSPDSPSTTKTIFS